MSVVDLVAVGIDPSAEMLRVAGFDHVAVQTRARHPHFTRDQALARLQGRFASSFALMSGEEFEAGLDAAEREMPDAFAATLRVLLVTAEPATAEPKV
jgi:hypothetical protein